jgi:membrane fusion protein (multidrug efflux system)
MIKRMVIMLVAVAVVFGGIFGFQAFKAVMIKKFIAGISNPPQTISAAAAATSEWQPKIEAIGSLRAVKGAELSLEASGVVESISFNSGDDVEAGAILLRLRTADDVARLDSLKAMAELNEITLDR